MERGRKEIFKPFKTKKAIAFFTIIPLMVILSIVKTDCPICDGTGQLSSLPGMEHVDIIRFSSDELYVTREVCEAYIVYKYNLAIEYRNMGEKDAQGYIKLILKEYLTGNIIDIQYVSVFVEGKSNVESNYIVYFGAGLDVPGKTQIIAEVVTGEIDDVLCNGTGKVPFNISAVLKGFQNSFKEEARTVKEYRPPVYYPPDQGWAE